MKKRMRESSIETVKLFFRYGAFYLLIFMLFLFLLLPIKFSRPCRRHI